MISRIRWPVWGMMLVIAALLIIKIIGGPITGLTTFANEGCCTLTCQQTASSECPAAFYAGKECTLVEECNVGCCIDTEGYCLSNYLAGNCAAADGMFITTSECLQLPACITAQPFDSLLGFTGYPTIFNSSQQAVLFAEPVAGRYGTPFTLKLQLLQAAESAPSITIEAESYQETRTLYDDGSHGDGNANDGLYAAVWQSASLPQPETMQVVKLRADNIAADGDELYVSPTSCLPVRKPWSAPETRQDIIFLRASATSLAPQFDAEIANILGQMLLIPGETLGARNIEKVADILLPPSDMQQLPAIAVQHCPFYQSDDYLISLDDTASTCQQNGTLIRTSPLLIFNQTALQQASLISFMADFCSFVTTEQQFREQQVLARSPPNVTLILPLNGSQHSTAELELVFQINDSKDAALSYEIYADINNPLTMLQRGTASSRTEERRAMTLADGVHDLWIEAIDSDGNLGHSSIATLNVNVSNFVIDIRSLDPLTYDHSPDINFTISHAEETEINYTVSINRTLQLNGTAARDQLITVPTALSEGAYVVQITAADSQQHAARSLPYQITVSGGSNP